jgi:outer membrane biosynthesis protein TonB
MLMDRPNRTFISSVLFLDIVGYSKQPVTEQIRLKEQFNTLVSHLISDIPESDRIVLDTGDGAALSFLGDPEDALFVAVKLRDSITEKQEAEFPDLHLRMGINLGPVKLLKDINGRPNLIGDGINVAQRVMNFAEPDQILVSRSFYDVVSCLSDEYRNLFSHQGLHTDKHVREHELYEIGFVDPDRSVTINQRMQVLETRSRLPAEQLDFLEKALEPHVGDHAHVLVQARAMTAHDFATLRNALAAHIVEPEAREAFMRLEYAPPKPAPARKPWLVPAAVAAACVLAVLGWWLTRGPSPAPDQASVAANSGAPAAAAPAAPAPAAAPASAPAPAPAPAVEPAPAATEPSKATAKAEEKKAEDKKATEKKAAAAKDSAKNAKAAPPSASAPMAAPAPAPAPPPEAPSASAQARARNATLRFQISGGTAEIWVDGVRIGMAGSVSQYAVTPGDHRIQVRECGFPPDTKNQSVSVEANGSKLIVQSC